MSRHHQIVIVGGGTAGITVAARLLRACAELDVAIIEPSEKQPVETFPFNQAKERRSIFLLKKYGLPAIYWHGMLKGRA